MDEVTKAINHFSVQVLHEVQATNEGVAAIREELARVPKRDESDELKQEVKTIKVAVTDIGP